MKTYFKINASTTFEQNIMDALLFANKLGLEGNEIEKTELVKGENKIIWAIDLTASDRHKKLEAVAKAAEKIFCRETACGLQNDQELYAVLKELK